MLRNKQIKDYELRTMFLLWRRNVLGIKLYGLTWLQNPKEM